MQPSPSKPTDPLWKQWKSRYLDGFVYIGHGQHGQGRRIHDDMCKSVAGICECCGSALVGAGGKDYMQEYYRQNPNSKMKDTLFPNGRGAPQEDGSYKSIWTKGEGFIFGLNQDSKELTTFLESRIEAFQGSAVETLDFDNDGMKCCMVWRDV